MLTLSGLLGDLETKGSSKEDLEKFRQFLRELDDPPNQKVIGREETFLNFCLEATAKNLESSAKIIEIGDRYFLAKKPMPLPNPEDRDNIEEKCKSFKANQTPQSKNDLIRLLSKAREDIIAHYLKRDFDDFLSE